MSNRSHIWKTHYQTMLQEIQSTGKIQPQYLHSTPKRYCAATTAVCCLSTFLFPCLIWDTLCCCASICCKKNPCRWGAAYHFADHIHEATTLDLRKNELKTISRIEIHPEDLYYIATSYYQAFQEALTNKKASQANIIRAELVTLISKYSPIIDHAFLQDNGDLALLQFAITELKPAR